MPRWSAGFPCSSWFSISSSSTSASPPTSGLSLLRSFHRRRDCFKCLILAWSVINLFCECLPSYTHKSLSFWFSFFPPQIRNQIIPLAILVSTLIWFLVTFFFQAMFTAMGGIYIFLFYALASLFFTITTFLFIPEMTDKSEEEIAEFYRNFKLCKRSTSKVWSEYDLYRKYDKNFVLVSFKLYVYFD